MPTLTFYDNDDDFVGVADDPHNSHSTDLNKKKNSVLFCLLIINIQTLCCSD